MADHRIRLTDRELVLARAATQAMCWAMLPGYQELSQEYRLLYERLQHIKPGGAPLATRKARKKALIKDAG